MDPVTIGLMISAASALMEGMKGEGGPEGAGLPAADSGAGNIFGENTQAKMMESMMGGAGVPQYAAGPAGVPELPQIPPALASIAPPQEPINPYSATQSSTFSQGVDAPNIVPPMGGSTGGDISMTGPMSLPLGESPLTAGSSGSYEAINAPEWQGPIQQTPPPTDPRLQDYMGMIGPMAGMAGAAMGGGNNRAPGSGGFPARPFQMAPSMASLPPRRRY